jgi:hypothetical protein
MRIGYWHNQRRLVDGKARRFAFLRMRVASQSHATQSCRAFILRFNVSRERLRYYT